MEVTLRAVLIGHAPLTALVPAASIVWGTLPQGSSRPAIVLHKVSGAEGITHSGPDGLGSAIVQIDVQALDIPAMWAIRDVVHELLHGYRDDDFRGIFGTGERQTSEDLAGVLIHRASLDFNVRAAA